MTEDLTRPSIRAYSGLGNDNLFLLFGLLGVSAFCIVLYKTYKSLDPERLPDPQPKEAKNVHKSSWDDDCNKRGRRKLELRHRKKQESVQVSPGAEKNLRQRAYEEKLAAREAQRVRKEKEEAKKHAKEVRREEMEYDKWKAVFEETDHLGRETAGKQAKKTCFEQFLEYLDEQRIIPLSATDVLPDGDTALKTTGIHGLDLRPDELRDRLQWLLDTSRLLGFFVPCADDQKHHNSCSSQFVYVDSSQLRDLEEVISKQTVFSEVELIGLFNKSLLKRRTV